MICAAALRPALRNIEKESVPHSGSESSRIYAIDYGSARALNCYRTAAANPSQSSKTYIGL